MTHTLSVDFSDVEKTFAEYVVLSRKSVSAAIKHQIGNWCVEAQKLIVAATKDKVLQPFLAGRDGPYNLLSWILSKGGKTYFATDVVSFKTVKDRRTGGRKSQAIFVDAITGYKFTTSRRHGTVQQRKQARNQYFSRSMRSQLFDKIVNKRVNAIHFTGMFLTKMANKTGNHLTSFPSGRGIDVEIQDQDTEDLISTAVSSSYDFTRSTTYAGQSNDGAPAYIEKLNMAALQSTSEGIVGNMEEYIASHLPGQPGFKGV